MHIKYKLLVLILASCVNDKPLARYKRGDIVEFKLGGKGVIYDVLRNQYYTIRIVNSLGQYEIEYIRDWELK